MTVFGKEMRQGLLSLIIWTAATAFMVVICVVLFPEMKGQMEDVSDMFANMGGFTAAFGMDRVSFGDLMGFYAIECGNILGIGGGFYAAFLGISVLANEEKDRTAEFLLTHPVSRTRVLTEKLLAVILQVLIFNVVVAAGSVISIKLIGESAEWEVFTLLHLAFLVLQLELACICFGISAFLKRGSIGIGLGLAAVFYFVNIIYNISDDLDFLKYLTPYTYAEASAIVADKELNLTLMGIGIAAAVIGAAVGYIRYNRKDIAA